MPEHVVIAGGGFGGLYAARRLLKAMPPQSVKVTLVNNRNFLLYAPLLPAAAGGTVEPRHVVVPLREGLGHGELRLGDITGADPAKHELHLDDLGPELRHDPGGVRPGDERSELEHP